MNDIFWRTPYSGQVRVACPAGSRTKPEYAIHFEDDGTQVLREIGTIDVYAEIQSHKQAVDIHHLIDVYSRTGDASIFARASSIYGDSTGIPTNYADLLNLRYKFEREFAELPAKIRGAFDNDVNRYVAQYGTENWAKVLGLAGDGSVDSDVSNASKTFGKDVKEDVESQR